MHGSKRPTGWNGLGRWSSALLAAVVCGAVVPAFVGNLRPAGNRWTDFFQDWASARNRIAGLPIYLDHREGIAQHLGYDVGDTTNNLVATANVIDRNAHPPTSVMLALPFGVLPYQDAVLAWNLASLSALVLSLWLIHRQVGLFASGWTALVALTLLFLSGPLGKQVMLGQFNLVLLLLLTGTWAASRTGRPHLAGALLGAATAVKLFPGFLFYYFALRRRWTTVLTGVLSLALVTGFTVLALGPECFVTYAAEIMPELAVYRSAWNNASLPGLWSKLFDPSTGVAQFFTVQPLWHSETLARLGALVSCTAVMLLMIPAVRRAHSLDQRDRAFGLAVIAMLLVSPVTWEHYFLLLMVPIAVTAHGFSRLTRLAQSLWLVSVAALWMRPLLVYKLFVPGFTSGVPTPALTLAILSFQCYGLLGLFAVSIAHSRARPVTSPVRTAQRGSSPCDEMEKPACAATGYSN